jgi:hypothetical protein
LQVLDDHFRFIERAFKTSQPVTIACPGNIFAAISGAIVGDAAMGMDTPSGRSHVNDARP